MGKEQKTNQAVYHPKGQYQVIDDSQRLASHGTLTTHNNLRANPKVISEESRLAKDGKQYNPQTREVKVTGPDHKYAGPQKHENVPVSSAPPRESNPVARPSQQGRVSQSSYPAHTHSHTHAHTHPTTQSYVPAHTHTHSHVPAHTH